MRLILQSLAAAAVLCGIPEFALAHSNGHESRTPAQCEKLPGTARRGERGQCLRCVNRPRMHHFHPDYSAGRRCRPDNGKP